MVSRLCGRQRVPSAQLGLGTMKGSAHTGRGDLVTKRDKEVTRYQSAFMGMVINVSIFLRANVLSPLPPPPPPPRKEKSATSSPHQKIWAFRCIIIFWIRQTQIFFRIIEISPTNSRSRFSIVIRTISLIPNSLPVGTHASEEAPFVKTSVYTDRTSKYGALHDLSGPILKGPVAFRGHQTPLGEKRRSVVKARFYIKARNEYLRIRFLPSAGSLQII